MLVIAKAQERLSFHQASALVDLSGYIGGLCQGLGDVLRDVRPIAVRVHCPALQVPGQLAVHIGLIVNELVTNSLKYAFPTERGGTIDVEVQEDGRGLSIVVADSGIGFPEEDRTGLGSKLVRLLAKQHGGTVTREPVEQGSKVRVLLPDLGSTS